MDGTDDWPTVFEETFSRPFLVLCFSFFFFPHLSSVEGGSPLLKHAMVSACYFCWSMSLTIIVRRLRNCWSTANLWAGRSRWRRWCDWLGSFKTSRKWKIQRLDKESWTNPFIGFGMLSEIIQVMNFGYPHPGSLNESYSEPKNGTSYAATLS